MTQLYSIIAVEPSPSNAIRAHEHPVLEPGNLSFPKGRYELDFFPGEDRSSFVVTHRIEGAPLINKLLELGRARYVCIVSSPISSYRQPHVSVTARQVVRWDADDLGEPPLFTPMIVCAEEDEMTLSACRDGVHGVWDEQKIVLHKGSRIALGNVIHLESSILHLLSLYEDSSLKDGQFVVEIETEPFRFRVNVSTELHRFLRYHQGDHRRNIMTHIVTACLARLQKEYDSDDGENGWKSHRNLRAFAEHLAFKGLEDWTDPDFRPERIATALYPHVMPHIRANDDEEGVDE